MRDSDNSTLYDFDPDAQPTNQKTITIVHVSEPHDVYGGRHSYGACMGETNPGSKGWLGNPYRVADHGRMECIEKFEQSYLIHLRDDRAFCNAVVSLAGRRVACHCRREHEDEPACHLDVVRRTLLDGTVYRIAHDIHDIPLTDAQTGDMADPEEVL